MSERETCWCPVHWRNCSKPLHLCGNILLLKVWAFYPRNGDMTFPETGWTLKPSLPPNFYLFLINWCHLVSLNCSIFPSFVFSWAWFNWKMTESHRAPSKWKDTAAEGVLGWYLFLQGSCWWGESLILTHCEPLIPVGEFFHPQENNPFFAVFYVAFPTGVTEGKKKGRNKM